VRATIKRKGYEIVKRTRSLLALLGPILFAIAIGGLTAWFLHDKNVAVLQPAGDIGVRERNLMRLGILMSIVVVVPVFALTIFIAWRYRETNPRPKKYQPNWDGSRTYESIWWGIPSALILILSIVTWVSSHSLDPYRPLSSTKKPLQVQVVALDWKWLFIYPDLHVASVNMLHVPVDTPVSFSITSDSVMNSFWIPDLGGQIYAMPGMSTKLHLIANKTGNFYGSPANISGSGYARMTFTARASSQAEFDAWVTRAQHTNNNLSLSAYNTLARPSVANSVQNYSPVQDDLYDGIVMKYMSHSGHASASAKMYMGTH
jgi:cytochrome o ubiquinol oxidase subunit 2